jgi:hypothetical protein
LYLDKTTAASTYLTTSAASLQYLTQTGASSKYLTKTDAENTYIKKGTGSAITKTSGFASITYRDGFFFTEDYSHVLMTVVSSSVRTDRLTAQLEID